jgi:hypothetical protein
MYKTLLAELVALSAQGAVPDAELRARLEALCRFTFNVSLLHFQLALNGLPQTLLFIGRYLKRWYRCEQGGIKAPVIF